MHGDKPQKRVDFLATLCRPLALECHGSLGDSRTIRHSRSLQTAYAFQPPELESGGLHNFPDTATLHKSMSRSSYVGSTESDSSSSNASSSSIWPSRRIQRENEVKPPRTM